MTRLVRRLRGALGLGVAWGVIWMAIGAIALAVIGIVRPQDIDAGEGPGRALPILGFVGFLSGLAFATLLSMTERRSTFRDSLPRGRSASSRRARRRSSRCPGRAARARGLPCTRDG